MRHFDLYLIGGSQVFSGHTKATRRHLFDARAHGIAGLQGDVFDYSVAAYDIGHGGGTGYWDRALGVFAAFPGIGFTAYAVHGNRQGRMRLSRNGAQGHGASSKAFDDLFRWLNFV